MWDVIEGGSVVVAGRVVVDGTKLTAARAGRSKLCHRSSMATTVESIMLSRLADPHSYLLFHQVDLHTRYQVQVQE